VQFLEEQLRRLPPSCTASHHPFCHPEGRVFCGPKDLCNLPPLRHYRQVAQVLRFAQDDKPYLAEPHHYPSARLLDVSFLIVQFPPLPAALHP
jgi:hypothetical protein